jgi:hypothetical protein
VKPIYITMYRYKARNELHMTVKDGRTGDAIDYPLIGHREVERLLHPALVRLMAKARAYAPEERRVGRCFVANVPEEVAFWKSEDEPALREILARLWGDTGLPSIGRVTDLDDPLRKQGEHSERLDDLPDLPS